MKASRENYYHYNKRLLPLAKYNRNNMTKSAACMWKYVLSRKQMLGFQFRRERPILNFIADFVCLELMLIIEVDGITHDSSEAIEKDIVRQKKLEEVGFSFLRFSSEEVLKDIIYVNNVIKNWIDVNMDLSSKY